MSVKFTLVSCAYTDHTHSQMIVYLRDNNSEPFPFFFCPHQDDNAPAYIFVHDLYDKGKLNPTIDTDLEDACLSEDIRQKRNQLLLDTDYLMVSDYPLSKDTKTKLKEYRKALRDITEQEGFPRDIKWPAKPELK